MSAPASINLFDIALDASTAARAYCRRARQLRGRFRDDAVALHLSLKQLAQQSDADAARTTPFRHRVTPARYVRSRQLSDAIGGASAVADENRNAATSPAFSTENLAPSLGASAATVDRFAEQVRSMLSEGVLRYDQRQSLLRAADQLRLGRFEASLIIAAVEHRCRTQFSHALEPHRAPKPIAGIVAVILLLEVTVVGIGWMFFV